MDSGKGRGVAVVWASSVVLVRMFVWLGAVGVGMLVDWLMQVLTWGRVGW